MLDAFGTYLYIDCVVIKYCNLSIRLFESRREIILPVAITKSIFYETKHQMGGGGIKWTSLNRSPVTTTRCY